MRKLFVLLVVTTVSFLAKSQTISAEILKTQLVRDWERAKAYTREYLDAMPADQYGFRAQDSIRTFAQQMLHLAQGNANLASNGTGKTRLWNRNLEASKTAQTKDSVSFYVMASYDYVIGGIKDMDFLTLEEKVKRGNLDETRLAWLMKAFEHQTHHRGQTTIYIRSVGLQPPNEKLF